MALNLAIAGASVGAAAGLLGASGAGLVIMLVFGAIAPVLTIAGLSLVGRMARVRRDGPPVASMAVAAGLALALAWAGLDLPALARPLPLPDLTVFGAFQVSVAVGGFAAAALAALALLGFGERAAVLRAAQPPRQARRRKARKEDDFS
jgi:hypothetical protein